MPSRRSGGGTTRRKHSLGNLRRAHPASGATWNVQVVRGKMSSKCLWHACRALILGLTLMLLGAGMATLGYYADHLSMSTELRGNATVRVKNDLKGFHLNNFSYVGPIVMGFGGFIVVASCVMTFEARDSAAKVVPARLRAGGGSKATVRSNQSSSASQRRAIGMQLQSSRWDQQFGVFRSSPADPPQPPPPFDRDALTAELIKFSKSLSSGRHMKSRGTRISNSVIQRATRETVACTLLQPPANRIYWHAASFDEGGRAEKQQSRSTERNRRSDTAKRHVLARQKPIEHEEDKNSPLGNRRNSTMSDSSYSGRWTIRCASNASRTSSIESRRIQVDLHSPEVMPKSILRSPKRYGAAPSATPSVEKEFRSQLSVCSEPPAVIRQLSGQSSLEPCVESDSADITEENTLTAQDTDAILPLIHTANDIPAYQLDEETSRRVPSILKKSRPDTLLLNGNAGASSIAGPPEHDLAQTTYEESRLLCRSHSSRTFYRPKPRIPKELDDSIFYIRSGERETSHSHSHSNDLYDSLRVINERRSTLLRTDSETTASERKLSSLFLLQEIPERMPPKAANTSIQMMVEEEEEEEEEQKSQVDDKADLKLQIEANGDLA